MATKSKSGAELTPEYHKRAHDEGITVSALVRRLPTGDKHERSG